MLKATHGILLGLALAIFASSAFAHEVAFVGAADWHKFTLGSLPANSTVNESAGLGYGGGVLVDLHMTPMVSIEPGFLYLQQKYTENSTAPVTDEKTKEFQVPLLIRYWFSPMVSIGVGGYYTFASGQITQVQSGKADVSANYAGNQKKNDYGVAGSLGFRFPLGSMTSLVVDGRYLYGLKDNNDGIYASGITMKNREYQALVGFSFGMAKSR